MADEPRPPSVGARVRVRVDEALGLPAQAVTWAHRLGTVVRIDRVRYGSGACVDGHVDELDVIYVVVKHDDEKLRSWRWTLPAPLIELPEG